MSSSVNHVMTKEQALASIDALASVNKDNVKGLKLSYSNDGTRIYTGSSSGFVRSINALGVGYFGGFNQDHLLNLPAAVDNIVATLRRVTLNSAELAGLSDRIRKAAAGIMLIYTTHYMGKELHRDLFPFHVVNVLRGLVSFAPPLYLDFFDSEK